MPFSTGLAEFVYVVFTMFRDASAFNCKMLQSSLHFCFCYFIYGLIITSSVIKLGFLNFADRSRSAPTLAASNVDNWASWLEISLSVVSWAPVFSIPSWVRLCIEHCQFWRLWNIEAESVYCMWMAKDLAGKEQDSEKMNTNLTFDWPVYDHMSVVPGLKPPNAILHDLRVAWTWISTSEKPLH